jgi:LysR family nitrogen assimilation transcriptional regulator
MDVKQLHIFASVAQAGTLSKAAIALSITQPVVTRQIRALEDELGVELFYRNGRGMILTDGGKLLLQHAEDILRSLAQAKSEVSAMRSMPSGKYAIGVPPSVGTVLTVPLVQKIKSEFRRYRSGSSKVSAAMCSNGWRMEGSTSRSSMANRSIPRC